MHEPIHEPIEVIASFSKNGVAPRIIRWHNRNYLIDQVNLIHTGKEGRTTVYYFSVSDKANYFKISFNTEDLSWRMEEMYMDG